MRRFGAWLVGAAILALTSGGAAQANPTFETFRDLCVTTRADASAALAAADRSGWTDMPAMFQDEIAKQGFGQGRGRAKMFNRALMLMYAGNGAPVVDGEPIAVKVCALGLRTSAGEALRKAATDWAGVPASPEFRKGQAFAFLDDGGVHRAFSVAEFKTPRGKDLIRQGRVAMLFVAGQPAAPFIVYAIPTL